MVNFEELQAIAGKAGRKDLTGTASERIRQINERTKTGVFVTGGMNCGKTTVLNGITGTMLREPGLLSEKEKPLRVVFEKAEEVYEQSTKRVSTGLLNKIVNEAYTLNPPQSVKNKRR